MNPPCDWPTLLSEALGDLAHARRLCHAEETARVAVAAAHAVAGMKVELGVVVGGKHVARQREVVELVDQADVDARGARRAVVAVDAAPGRTAAAWRPAVRCPSR